MTRSKTSDTADVKFNFKIEGDGAYKRETKRRDRREDEILEDGRTKIPYVRQAQVLEEVLNEPRF